MANVIQPVSQGAANNLLEFMPTLQNNRKQKIITIVNGIDTSRFLIQESRDLHSELSLDRNVFLVGFLGRFMSQKGFTYLVQAVKKLLLDTSINRKIKIIAIGSGGYIREEMEGIESQGMKDDVYFLPGTNEVAKTLRGLDLLAMPSLWEACSLLAMEALVAGVPVVGTDCIGLGEVLEGSPAKIVHTRDVDELAEAILEHVITNRKDEFNRYAKIAAQRFDISRVVNELIQLYQAQAISNA